ncbi:MAG: MBL fold metallo-hydrolase [Sphaerochaetaceae bacterium]|jgi:phosphoribosyl 1,2-cyclic phosphodiesterase
MVSYSVLGSGSSGNSYLIAHAGEALLIDCGFSFKEIKKRIGVAGFDINNLQGLLLTHLHPDHARGAGVFARQTGKPVFVNAEVLLAPELVDLRIPVESLIPFKVEQGFTLASFKVESFATMHDSPHSVGFAVEVAGKQLAILTDTGTFNNQMVQVAQKADVLFLEANYDETMLLQGPYPHFLKMRILGQKGHLSNDEAIELLNALNGGPQRVYFCHLSKTNNHPRVVAESCKERLQWVGEVTICHHGEQYNGTL